MTHEGVSARWSVYAPFYDAFIGFEAQRRRSIERLELRNGQRVLIVGAGTGLDLPLLPDGVHAIATDLTPAMLAHARPRVRDGAQLAVMDGEALAVPDASVNAVVLHLILAVIPDGARCLAEAARVVRPGGRIAVFDKFLADGAAPGLVRSALNLVTSALATDINRRLADLVRDSGAPLVKRWDEPAGYGGLLRIAGFERTT